MQACRSRGIRWTGDGKRTLPEGHTIRSCIVDDRLEAVLST